MCDNISASSLKPLVPLHGTCPSLRQSCPRVCFYLPAGARWSDLQSECSHHRMVSSKANSALQSGSPRILGTRTSKADQATVVLIQEVDGHISAPPRGLPSFSIMHAFLLCIRILQSVLCNSPKPIWGVNPLARSRQLQYTTVWPRGQAWYGLNLFRRFIGVSIREMSR